MACSSSARCGAGEPLRGNSCRARTCAVLGPGWISGLLLKRVTPPGPKGSASSVGSCLTSRSEAKRGCMGAQSDRVAAVQLESALSVAAEGGHKPVVPVRGHGQSDTHAHTHTRTHAHTRTSTRTHSHAHRMFQHTRHLRRTRTTRTLGHHNTAPRKVHRHRHAHTHTHTHSDKHMEEVGGSAALRTGGASHLGVL